MKLRQSPVSKGFTIVELLIVVVVIAILAAITIVAYNGIQNRAKTSAIASNLDTYAKSFELFKVENGAYPSTDEYEGYDSSVCLGTTEDYPASGDFPAGACAYWGDGSYAHYALSGEEAEDFNNKMRPYVSALPSGVMSVVHDVADDGDEEYTHDDAYYRGIIYHPTQQWEYDEETDSWNEFENAHLHYYLPQDQTCPKGDTYSLDTVTECVVTLGPPDVDTDQGRHGGEA